MKTSLLLSMLVAVSCSTSGSTSNAPDPVESSQTNGTPILGVGFGRLVTIEATPIVEHPAKGPVERLLRVRSIDGVRASDGLLIAWTYGGWLAETPEPTGQAGFLVEPGRMYRLRGYEAGRWEGRPWGIHSILVDDPPQSAGFHFHSVFRVVDGDLRKDEPQ